MDPGDHRPVPAGLAALVLLIAALAVMKVLAPPQSAGTWPRREEAWRSRWTRDRHLPPTRHPRHMESKEVVTDLNHRPVLTVETAFVLLAAVLVVITALPHAGLATALLAGAAVAGLLAKLLIR